MFIYFRVPYLKSYPSVPGNPHCEFRGSGRSCSRSAAGISACSRPARQCPDRPVTPRSNPGMHAVSENSEFRIPKCPDCIRAKSVRIPVLLILLHILIRWRGTCSTRGRWARRALGASAQSTRARVYIAGARRAARIRQDWTLGACCSLGAQDELATPSKLGSPHRL